MNNACILSESSMTVYTDGQQFLVPRDHENFDKIKKSVKDNKYELVKGLFEKPVDSFYYYVDGKVSICGDQVVYDGETLSYSICNRIVQMRKDGFAFKHMLKCLERVLQNPSAGSIESFYDFLEHKNIPITEDGYILAYKGVDDNYMDCWTHTVDNGVGGKIKRMPRNKVNDDRNVGCSFGYHVGSLDYALHYGSKTMIVKVDPADIVSVPYDCEQQKMRVCHYEVIGEYERPLFKPIYSEDGSDFEEDYDNGADDYDDPYDDDDWDDLDEDGEY